MVCLNDSSSIRSRSTPHFIHKCVRAACDTWHMDYDFPGVVSRLTIPYTRQECFDMCISLVSAGCNAIRWKSAISECQLLAVGETTALSAAAGYESYRICEPGVLFQRTMHAVSL